MYKLQTKNGSVFFMTIDEALFFISKMGTTLFDNGAYIKITFVEEFNI